MRTLSFLLSSVVLAACANGQVTDNRLGPKSELGFVIAGPAPSPPPSGLSDAGRPVVFVTPEDPSQRFFVDANGYMNVTADTVSRLGLSDNRVIGTDTLNPANTGNNLDLNAVMYPGAGEWMRVDAFCTIAQRAATRLGYSGATGAAQLAAGISDLVGKSNQAQYVLNPSIVTGDVCRDTLRSSLAVAMGTATDGNEVFALTCGGSCHESQEAKTGQDSMTRVTLQPYTFRGTVKAPATYEYSVSTLAKALAAELAAGPQAGDPQYLQAIYALATQAQADMNGTNCTSRWHCSQTNLQSLLNVATPLYALRRAYVLALYVDASVSNLGATTGTYDAADATIDSYSTTFSRADFDVGGARVGITDAALKNQALTAIPELPIRSGSLESIGMNEPVTLDFTSANGNLADAFAASWANGSNLPEPVMGFEGYLFGATYYRSLAFNDLNALPAGWTAATVAAAMPRYAMENHYSLAETYFQSLLKWESPDGGTLPSASLCSWSTANINSAIQAFDSVCASCHAGVSKSSFLLGAEAPIAMGAPGLTYGANIENAIIAANGATSVPSLMSGAVVDDPALTPAAVLASTSDRVGPFGEPMTSPYAGWNSVTDFLNMTTSGIAPSGFVVPPRSRTCVAQAPIASGNASSRSNLIALYGIPEQTGNVSHPLVTNLRKLTSAQKAQLANFLVGPMADGAYFNSTTGAVTQFRAWENLAASPPHCNTFATQATCEATTSPVCYWDAIASKCAGY